MSTRTLDKLAYTPAEFHQAGGPARSSFYELVNAGRIKAVKQGRKTLILREEVERFFASLPAYNDVPTPPVARRQSDAA